MSQIISEFVSAPSIEVMLIVGRAIALVCGFLVLAWALSQWRRNAQRDTQRVFEQLDLVRSELLIMKEVMHDAAHRTELPTIEPRLPSASPAPAVRGYEIAARMARNGASKDELIRSAGITPHDARPATFTASAAATKAPPAEAGLIGRQQRSAVNGAAPVQQREAVKAPAQSAPRPQPQPKVHSRLVAVG
jgi:hypothetical protein